MKVDVLCVGDPFLDLIFLGLPSMPALGEERLARRLKIVPGGMGNVAFALRQLGLDAAICAPIGRDLAGRILAELMAEFGVPWHGRPAEATPVSVALPVDGDRALVTVMPDPTVDTETMRQFAPRAMVVDLPSVPLLPPMPATPRVYAVVGDPEVAMLAGRLPDSLEHVHAFVLNQREAAELTGRPAASAAAHLASLGTTVVVTGGATGAIAVEPDGRTIEVAARAATVADATGAGDLFVAAYIWADLAGHGLEERLRLATSYASLSLERATDQLKGITVDELDDLLAG
ncbi:MAG TPA: PfkB family carbohydrate kinase [Candidatus Limnocylindrales bacterium]|nr:PfkB family carbohydrate kinase [Candidatus Limnocylindrales bacterium]